jgi:hypothetical protein
MNTKLFHDALAMLFDGSNTDLQSIGGFFVGRTFDD